MAVSKRTRFEILRRDNYTCRYCRSTENELTIDHVTPVALGGTDEPSNLVACCKDCNAGKTSTSPDTATVEDVTNDALRWSAAMTKAAEMLSDQAGDRNAYIDSFLAAWPSYRSAPTNMTDAVGRFFDLGLPESVMVEAALVAGSARGIHDRQSYFAGICWKRIRTMQEMASGIVAEVSS